MIQKEYRLTRRKSFNYIYRKGNIHSTPLLTMYSVPAHNLKIGVVVGKKVGNSVVRSRVKRRISERFRLLIPYVDKKRNFIVIARSACADRESSKINEDLIYLLKKFGAYSEKENEVLV